MGPPEKLVRRSQGLLTQLNKNLWSKNWLETSLQLPWGLAMVSPEQMLEISANPFF